MEELEKLFENVLKEYTSDFVSFYDNNESEISKRNNRTYHGYKKEQLHRELIYKSKDFTGLKEKEVSDLIYSCVGKFDLLINPNSRS